MGDRRIHPLVSEHLPADVDLEGGVRRVGPYHRAQEVLLKRTASCSTTIEPGVLSGGLGSFAGFFVFTSLRWACRMEQRAMSPRFMLAASECPRRTGRWRQ